VNGAQLSRIAASLRAILDPHDRDDFLGDFATAEASQSLEAFERLAEEIKRRHALSAAALAERTLQLELALSILRERDQAAAEQSEWDFATELQMAGLPQDFPPYPERHDLDIYAGMVTAKEVGGDLYDFFLLAPDRFGFIVADAAGKGLPAAIFITLTRTLLRAAANRLPDPGDCLRAVNAMLCLENPNMMFTTGFLGILDTSSGELSFAIAGHDPPYILRKDASVELMSGQGGMALGISEECAYPTGTVRLAPGETVVCFSDGVTEAIDASGQLFGKQRLMATLVGKNAHHPTEIVAELVGEVDRFIGITPIADDITVLAVRYNGETATR
jgi:sigma-B regulation protein RsbU (phosphoserine phosphatase)